MGIAYSSYTFFLYIIYIGFYFIAETVTFLITAVFWSLNICCACAYVLGHIYCAYLVSYKAENYHAFYRHGIEIWVRIFQKPCPSSIPIVILVYGHGEKCNSYPTFLHLMLVLSWLKCDLEGRLLQLKDIVVMEIILLWVQEVTSPLGSSLWRLATLHLKCLRVSVPKWMCCDCDDMYLHHSRFPPEGLLWPAEGWWRLIGTAHTLRSMSNKETAWLPWYWYASWCFCGNIWISCTGINNCFRSYYRSDEWTTHGSTSAETKPSFAA